MTVRASPPRSIATRREGPLHAALKTWYAEVGDREEVPLVGRQIDLVRGDLLIEIQTGGFASIRTKLAALLEDYDVRVVHPVPVAKWIVRAEGDDLRPLGRTKARKKGRLEDAFEQLVSLPTLLAHPRFSFEVVLTHEEEVRRHEPGRARRRKGWVIVERRLIGVVGRRLLQGRADWRALLPPGLPAPFTTADLAETLKVSQDLAQKMVYCLRQVAAVEATGKIGNAITYREVP